MGASLLPNDRWISEPLVRFAKRVATAKDALDLPVAFEACFTDDQLRMLLNAESMIEHQEALQIAVVTKKMKS